MNLSRNSKMKKSTGIIYNFGIPNFKSASGFITCPNASKCVSGCYAGQGTYNFKNVKNSYERRLELTFKPEFVSIINAEINLLKVLHKGQSLSIRIHDSGDFYNYEYLAKWLNIISMNPDVNFYAYTKQVSMFKNTELHRFLKNYTLIYSMGGKEDHLINLNTDRHSMVFETLAELNEAGYINASNDDAIAFNSENKKIGLVYHGVKRYDKTTFKHVFLNKQ